MTCLESKTMQGTEQQSAILFLVKSALETLTCQCLDHWGLSRRDVCTANALELSDCPFKGWTAAFASWHCVWLCTPARLSDWKHDVQMWQCHGSGWMNWVGFSWPQFQPLRCHQRKPAEGIGPLRSPDSQWWFHEWSQAPTCPPATLL